MTSRATSEQTSRLESPRDCSPETQIFLCREPSDSSTRSDRAADGWIPGQLVSLGREILRREGSPAIRRTIRLLPTNAGRKSPASIGGDRRDPRVACGHPSKRCAFEAVKPQGFLPAHAPYTRRS